MEEREIRENFAKNISSLRKSLKYNQAQLAEKLNYSDKAVSKWENGETMPDIFTLEKIASFFNITVDQLITSKDVVKESFKARNRLVITAASIGLCFLLGAIAFLFLDIFAVRFSILAIIGSFIAAFIVYLVLSAVWYSKLIVFIAITGLIWTTTLLLVILFRNVNASLWTFAVIALLVNALFLPLLFIKKQ